MRKPIIAIDGPAGAGKSTIAKLLAQQLGLLYMDTGAMYRAITWAVLQANLSFSDEEAIAELANCCEIELAPATAAAFTTQVKLNGIDISREIRSEIVTKNVAAIAAQAKVRLAMVSRQKEIGQAGGIVMEGRDIGTTVFPDAEVKIFLTASVQKRATRRLSDLQRQSLPTPPITQVEFDIAARDLADSSRQVSPLRQAESAIVIDTDGLTIEMVVDKIIELYQNYD